MKNFGAIIVFIFALAVLVLPCFAGATKGALKRGKKVFQDMQCAICHEDGGNKLNPEKPIKGAAFIKKYPADKEIEKLIRTGIPTRGMPAFEKDKLSDHDMADVLVYVRSLTPEKKKK